MSGPWKVGPREAAAQERLDAAQDSGARLTLAEAEALSDACWEAREADLREDEWGDDA